MTTLQFPSNPEIGDEYDYPPYKYYWDGQKWKTKGIGYNPVNDLRNEVLPTTREAIRRSYAEAGFTLVDGSFEEGGTLTSASDVLLHKASGIAYSGPIGQVAAGTDPTFPGGGYVSRADVVLRNELADDTGANLVKFKLGPIAAAVGDKLSSAIDAFADCGCVPNLTTDQSAQMQAAVELAASLGRQLVWRSGTYLGRIDFSGITGRFDFVANNALFRPFSASQTEVFYCKKSSTYPTVSGQFSALPVTFFDTNVSAKLLSATSDTDASGHTNYGVNFICTSAVWVRSSWTYGKIASYYGYYHQYGVFYDCRPAATVFSNNSIGMLLDGNTSNEASNENRIYGIKLFSNKNGLVIKGGIKNRIYTPTVQDTKAGGGAGIFLTADSSGFGVDGTEIHGVYAEINNSVPCIKVGVAPNTVINGVEFLSNIESIVTTHCYNLTLNNVNGYNGGSVTVVHPSGNSDTASLTVNGGNIKPSIGIDHNGPSNISVDQPAIKNSYSRNLNRSTGKLSRNSVPIVDIDFCGAVPAIPKATVTTLLSLKLDTFNTSQYRVMIGKLHIRAWSDADSSSSYGYSGRLQSYNVFISTVSDGVAKVYVSVDGAGVDMGGNTAFQAIGNITLTTGIVSGIVYLYVQWDGAGTGAASMSTACMEYKLELGGTNSVWI